MQERRRVVPEQNYQYQPLRARPVEASYVDPRARLTPRHQGIFEALRRLDTNLSDADRQALRNWVKEQYETHFGGMPVGFVSSCHLGAPYIDHRLDLLLSIVDHFTPLQAMPEPYEGARMLARSGAYEFVEVHSNGELIPVRTDGSAVGS